MASYQYLASREHIDKDAVYRLLCGDLEKPRMGWLRDTIKRAARRKADLRVARHNTRILKAALPRITLAETPEERAWLERIQKKVEVVK